MKYKVTLDIETEMAPEHLQVIMSELYIPGIKQNGKPHVHIRRKGISLSIAEMIAAQKQWIEEHGGTIAGYVARYGSMHAEEFSGAGGEAIYAADIAELNRLEHLR